MAVVHVGTTVLVGSILSNLLFLHPYQKWPEPRTLQFRHPKTHSVVYVKSLNLKYHLLYQLRSVYRNLQLVQEFFLAPLSPCDTRIRQRTSKSQRMNLKALAGKYTRTSQLAESACFQFSPLLEKLKSYTYII